MDGEDLEDNRQMMWLLSSNAQIKERDLSKFSADTFYPYAVINRFVRCKDLPRVIQQSSDPVPAQVIKPSSVTEICQSKVVTTEKEDSPMEEEDQVVVMLSEEEIREFEELDTLPNKSLDDEEMRAEVGAHSRPSRWGLELISCKDSRSSYGEKLWRMTSPPTPLTPT